MVPTFPKLSETFVRSHVDDLLARGNEVTIIAGAPGASQLPSAHQPTSSPKIVYRPPKTTLAVAHSLVGGALRSPRSALGAALDSEIGVRQRGGHILDAASFRRAGNQNVYHCHFGPTGDRTVRTLRHLRWSTPVVTTFHGFDLTQHIEAHGRDTYRHLFERGALFLPVSRFFATRLLELGADAARVRVQHMGIHPDNFPARSSWRHRPHDPFRVIMVGRMVEKKGMSHGLHALAELRQSDIDVRCTIIGEGPLRARLEALAVELDLARQVTFTGPLSNEAVREHLYRHDVLIAPSVTAVSGDMEGIPVVIMEAMAAQLPVVSTTHSGIPELVLDGRSGLLAPEGDAHALAEHLGTLARDPDLARRFGHEGRLHVEAEFNLHRLGDTLMRLYAEMATDR